MSKLVQPYHVSALLLVLLAGTASPAHALTNSGLDTNSSKNILNFSLNAAQAMMLSTSPRIDPSIVIGNVANPTLSLEGMGQVTFQLFNDGSGVNQKYSEIIDQGGVVTFRTVNDAYDAASNYLTAVRAAGSNAIGYVEFPSGYVQTDNGLLTKGTLPVPAQLIAGLPQATSYFGGSPEILVNGDNHAGGGIAISDDGGFYDYNDKWITFNGANGLKIAGNNGPGSGSGQLQVNGTLTVNGQAAVQSDANDTLLDVGVPANYAGMPQNTVMGYGVWSGIHTWDLYASDAIGLGNPTAGVLMFVNQNRAQFNMYVFANGYFHLSDARTKDNIRTAPGLGLVDQLRGVTFTWKKDGKQSAGVVAQEVEKVLPSAVITGTDGNKMVEYDQLIGPMIEAIKELDAHVKAQQAEIDGLKAQIAQHP